MKRVLVLDACQRSALSVTRSLGSRDIPVITADETPTALAGCSRFSNHYFRYPSPGREPDRFIAALAGCVREQDIQMILPMTELTTTLLLRNQPVFSGVIIPFPDPGTVDSLADKCSLMRLAESLQVPMPKTRYVDDPGEFNPGQADLSYPVVLKPGKSWLTGPQGWFHSSVRIAHDLKTVENHLKSDPAFKVGPFLVQQCVSGTGQGVFALYDHGKALAFFAHRRLREKPPSGGVSVLSESVPVDPVLLGHARALLDTVGWHGIAMVEFKVGDDGTPYLMEINTRFWGSLQLAIDAGVDFPYLLYQLASDQRPRPVNSYKTGKRLRWLLGDLDSLYLTVRDRKVGTRDKLMAILRFLRPQPFKTRHEVNRWGDLGPFWCELKQYVRDIC
jgi:predicted ATP-grasp superfamily ATP-dependent carboligase